MFILSFESDAENENRLLRSVRHPCRDASAEFGLEVQTPRAAPSCTINLLEMVDHSILVCHWLCQCGDIFAADSEKHWQNQWHTFSTISSGQITIWRSRQFVKLFYKLPRVPIHQLFSRRFG
jgi:hypothetical protein